MASRMLLAATQGLADDVLGTVSKIWQGTQGHFSVCYYLYGNGGVVLHQPWQHGRLHAAPL